MPLRDVRKWFRISPRSADKKDKNDDGVRFAVMGDQIFIRERRGSVTGYKLDFLRSRIKRGEKDGEDMSLEKRALEAYDQHLAEQRRLLEERLNKRANRIKSAAVQSRKP